MAVNPLSERFPSSDLHVEGPTPSRYWGDQWLRVSEKVLQGLNHQLTNRVTSLEAVVGIMDPELVSDDPLVHTIGAEVSRLHELLMLYRSLTSELLSPPEAVRLQDVLPVVVGLHEHHTDLRHIPCLVQGDADTKPVLVRHSALLRCVLVLLESVAGNTLRSRTVGEIVVEFGSTDGEIFLRLTGSAPQDQLLFSGEGSLLHAVRAALSHAHCTIEGLIRRDHTGAQIEYEMRLPTLTATRHIAREDR